MDCIGRSLACSRTDWVLRLGAEHQAHKRCEPQPLVGLFLSFRSSVSLEPSTVGSPLFLPIFLAAHGINWRDKLVTLLDKQIQLPLPVFRYAHFLPLLLGKLHLYALGIRRAWLLLHIRIAGTGMVFPLVGILRNLPN